MLWGAHILAAAVVAACLASRAASQQLARRRPRTVCCWRRSSRCSSGAPCRPCCRQIRRPGCTLRCSRFCRRLQRLCCYFVGPRVEAAGVVAAPSAAALSRGPRRLVPANRQTAHSRQGVCYGRAAGHGSLNNLRAATLLPPSAAGRNSPYGCQASKQSATLNPSHVVVFTRSDTTGELPLPLRPPAQGSCAGRGRGLVWSVAQRGPIGQPRLWARGPIGTAGCRWRPTVG